MWQCPKCGEEIEDFFDACSKCGTEEYPEAPEYLEPQQESPIIQGERRRSKRRPLRLKILHHFSGR